jgi:hypothetical protein
MFGGNAGSCSCRKKEPVADEIQHACRDGVRHWMCDTGCVHVAGGRRFVTVCEWVGRARLLGGESIPVGSAYLVRADVIYYIGVVVR